MRTAPTAIGVYVNPTMKVFSVDSVKKDITASPFAKGACVRLVDMVLVMNLENASVMMGMPGYSATAVQMATMVSQTVERVIVTPLARTVDSVTIQPGSVPVSPTSEVFSVTAVQKIWWAFPRVSSVTVMQMVPDSCLVLPTECVTVQPSISAFVSPTLWAAHVIVACMVSTTLAAATPLVVHPVAAHMLGLCRVHATVMRKMGAANARIM